jgi:hypothetical protein
VKLHQRLKVLILSNKTATIIGILIGGIWTRFLDEDGNLPVTIVFTGITTTASIVTWLALKQIFKAFRKPRPKHNL